MGVLAERLAALRVHAALPTGDLAGEFSTRDGVHISFAPFTYDYMDERELEHKLGALARLLWAAQSRAYFAAVSDAFGQAVTKEPPAMGQRDQEYDRARAELLAEGGSADGRIRVTVRGMRDWSVEIADDTVRTLTEQAFTQRVREAAAVLLHDQIMKVQMLKARIYG
jgi:hypothetical protein